MRERIVQFDWRHTDLGPLPHWEPSLRIAIDMMLLSSFPSAVVWGPNMTVVHNDSYVALLGGLDQALGRRFDSLWSNVWDDIGPWVFKALQGGTSFVDDQPYEIKCAKTGGQAWYVFSYAPIRDEHHEVVGMLHTVIQSSAGVTAHGKWREQAQTFERQIARYMADRDYMWRLSRDAMITVSLDLKMLAANPAWHRALGWSEVEVRGMSILELVHPADRDEVEAAAIDFVNDRGPAELETRVRHVDGHYRWFHWSGSFDGSVLTAVGRDITGDREAAMRQSQVLLRNTQRLEVVGHLAGGMAHEMNNLLSGIGGSLELLQRRLSQGRMERIDSYVALARDSVQRAMNLTHRLLVFSRHQPLAPAPLDMNRHLAAMEPMLRHAVGTEMSLSWELDVDPWTVCLDVGQLESSLINLCANAREACLGRGNVAIRTINTRLASAFPEEGGLAPGDYLGLQIMDDGHGMPAKDVAKAFEPFFTTKPTGRGSGMGLAMVHGFVGQSGGYVWIESSPGQGTKVCMLFPRCLEAIPQTPAAAMPQVSLASGRRVLLIDDEHNLRTVMGEYLRERGFTVSDVADANTAMERFRHDGPYDLVITDIGLPEGFSGQQLAKVMRTVNPCQKMLFITGYTDQPLEPGLLQVPGTALLIKPFELSTLANQALLLLDD
ncbi:PAS domain-containing sensor histidine kinase [Pseudomonas sp. M5]|uniref:hybrid sensor histidine kinase/response regulator n=1 Tax=unclassified Pseudomonas TaxID=196821 RepID=UPI001956AAB7|nr:ATP-binding protein [Pseudomonas sp. M5]HDS1757566.1 PAS domain-containing protein [Pseudomonas putida]